ncbi:2-C-methyl-D-erythritol 4-phosphate cytidylyltransferase [Mycolicibacterium bacteremicum]|uniref:2-C-methyl-D-erythritol 4-phosphate cytidylyltransferase n=1 Tax=Mycolicibacterium bacteremicum TaxID=564198 RepID=UPI0026F16FEE|nr:2-C-methyl-D-erythritol 4-phosphate cytidylyltransferase [Mycolicibacterium bacteremicum]
MRLCAILPLPPDEDPAAALTPLAGEPAVCRIVRSLATATDRILVLAGATLAGRIAAALDGLPVEILEIDESHGRADCLTAAAGHLRRQAITHVLLADHRHPLLAADLIDRVTEALAGGAELVIPVLPVTDTVKVVDAGGTITATVDRATLQLLQYPRGSTVDRLMVDDLAGAVTVAGDADAVAAELPADAALLEAVIACR